MGALAPAKSLVLLLRHDDGIPMLQRFPQSIGIDAKFRGKLHSRRRLRNLIGRF